MIQNGNTILEGECGSQLRQTKECGSELRSGLDWSPI
jgi:hypothetical protein